MECYKKKILNIYLNHIHANGKEYTISKIIDLFEDMYLYWYLEGVKDYHKSSHVPKDNMNKIIEDFTSFFELKTNDN